MKQIIKTVLVSDFGICAWYTLDENKSREGVAKWRKSIEKSTIRLF